MNYRHVYAVEVRRALETRNVTQANLARAVGISPRQVWYWITARSLPYLESARKAADALDWPSLIQIVQAARTSKCRTCGRRIVSETSNMSRRYCDETCRRVGVKAGRQGTVPDARDGKIALLQAGVDAMCQSCEPTSICSDGACPLRNVSPFPLRKGLALIPIAIDGRKSRWDNPAEHDKASASLKALWAGSEKRRQRTADWNRVKWATMTPEERAERGRRISEGLRRAKVAAA